MKTTMNPFDPETLSPVGRPWAEAIGAASVGTFRERNLVKTFRVMLVAASFGVLVACGGQGDDTTGDIVANDADKAADTIEAQADVAADAGNEVAADVLNEQADATREAGADAEEAIDDADVDTNNPAASAAAIEQQSGLPTSAETAAEANQAKQ